LKKPQAHIPLRKPKVDPEIKKKVIAFYLRDDVSVFTPGHADSMVVRQKNGEKQTFQKRYLLCSLKEAHAHFVSEEGRKLVSLSFFCKRRPPYVLPFGNIPHNVCVCRLHDDFFS
jgi:hypothetical protein